MTVTRISLLSQDLLENMLTLMSGKDGQTLTLVTDSLVRLLEVQAALLDQLPATGYLNRVLSTMNSLGEAGQKAPILLLHASTKSAVCVDSLANCDCVAPLHRAMRLRKDMLVVTCETFNRMFNYNHDSLVSQALNSGLVKDLLNILGSRLENIPNASACKAQVAAAVSSLVVFVSRVSGCERSQVDAAVPGVRGPGERPPVRQLHLGPVRESEARPLHRGQASGGIPDLPASDCWVPHHVQVRHAECPASHRGQRQHGQPGPPDVTKFTLPVSPSVKPSCDS